MKSTSHEEHIMKTESKKSAAGKIAAASIIALVLVGAAAIMGVSEISEKSSFLSKAFVFFISAVIVVQVVPGLMLMVAMLKGAFSMVSKKNTAAVSANSK
jgi:ABC-type molybdate transport system permease subunit